MTEKERDDTRQWQVDRERRMHVREIIVIMQIDSIRKFVFALIVLVCVSSSVFDLWSFGSERIWFNMCLCKRFSHSCIGVQGLYYIWFNDLFAMLC